MSREGKRDAERRGRRAETLSAWWLRLHGWRILARRSRHGVGEIDLVARRGGTVAFVEVKARRHRADAAAAISPRAQARIARAAEAYLAAHPALQGLALRFDVLLVTPRRPPVHIPNAWHILR